MIFRVFSTMLILISAIIVLISLYSHNIFGILLAIYCVVVSISFHVFLMVDDK